MDHQKRIMLAASLGALATAATGLMSKSGSAEAADALDPFNVRASSGESPEAMQREAALNISAYEDEDKEGGGGAPQKTLIDNDKVKVILVAYKKGFERSGGVKRRYNTLLVYIDPGRYTITRSGANTPVKRERHSKLPAGSAVFHRKNSIVSALRVDEDYRVMYVEMKG